MVEESPCGNSISAASMPTTRNETRGPVGFGPGPEEPRTAWAWDEGHYVQAPQAQAVWEPGHWEQQAGGGYVWVDGHWRS